MQVQKRCRFRRSHQVVLHECGWHRCQYGRSRAAHLPLEFCSPMVVGKFEEPVMRTTNSGNPYTR
eukprot:3715141-Prorocentrum_lima.AAC.1